MCAASQAHSRGYPQFYVTPIASIAAMEVIGVLYPPQLGKEHRPESFKQGIQASEGRPPFLLADTSIGGFNNVARKKLL